MTTSVAQCVTLAMMFEAQVDIHPAAVAVHAPDSTWSYRELDAEANRLAGYLTAAEYLTSNAKTPPSNDYFSPNQN
ncbi:hypothetical protein D5S18_25165 [Nocardia panacis]|uniref:AMP-dependent synthetase/ligase domain-containing protein n=1 Tax=Nocardia panacis TaxID=2340916 RepID=A0A3A4KFP6_9NOCA|nr:AMP-binding protein [Nocardia panacis]RJO71458.1 hypothetical protein D5S18_25165 [Nocardia panacis]